MGRPYIKALSQWQPFASLTATGAKRIETRGWYTHYRGPIVMCAAKKRVQRDINFYLMEPMFQAGLAPLVGKPLDLANPQSYGVTIDNLPFGVALCVVDIVDCRRMTVKNIRSVSAAEIEFGIYSPGRHMWMLDNLRVFPKPFPVAGVQGMFNLTLDLEEALAA